jgi:hypothetical protein
MYSCIRVYTYIFHGQIGLGEKAVDALLSFAREDKSRSVVEGLLAEMTIIPVCIDRNAAYIMIFMLCIY